MFASMSLPKLIQAFSKTRSGRDDEKYYFCSYSCCCCCSCYYFISTTLYCVQSLKVGACFWGLPLPEDGKTFDIEPKGSIKLILDNKARNGKHGQRLAFGSSASLSRFFCSCGLSRPNYKYKVLERHLRTFRFFEMTSCDAPSTGFNSSGSFCVFSSLRGHRSTTCLNC